MLIAHKSTQIIVNTEEIACISGYNSSDGGKIGIQFFYRRDKSDSVTWYFKTEKERDKVYVLLLALLGVKEISSDDIIL